ncbi:MAG: hypothetical protein R3F46_13220, partial [bacterium]
WNVQVLDTTDGRNYTSLQFDSLDMPHIAYIAHQESLLNEFKHAQYDGNQWNIDTIDNLVGYFGYCNMLIKDDVPYIVYQDDGKLKLVVKTGLNWVETNITDMGVKGAWCSADWKSENTIGVSCYDYDNTDLLYVEHNVGGGTIIKIADNNGIIGKWTSLDYNSSGLPCISYYDDGNRTLKFAEYKK